MKRERSASGAIGKYIRWSPAYIVLALAGAVMTGIYPQYSLYVAVGVTLAALVLAILLYLFYRHTITKSLVRFAMEAEKEQKRLMNDLDVPYALMDGSGRIAWYNRAFGDAVSGDNAARRNLSAIFPQINAEELEGIKDEETYHFGYHSKRYEVVIRTAAVEGEAAYALYLYDETELTNMCTRYDNDRQTVGIICIDNYEEVTQSVEEVKRSLLLALVDRSVSRYISGVDGIVKKLEKDKYLFLIKKIYLEQLKTERFSILEDVKKVNIGNEMNVTVSIGIGLCEESFSKNYDNAKTAIDMALARGGDQAVIKEGSTISYYGGKSQSIEKSTRVKARVKAEALREIISSKDRVVIMGHRLMDIDCLGAAVGLWKIACGMEKEAHIITGEVSGSIRQMLERFRTGEYPEDMFISKAKSMEIMDENTVLAIVDVNKAALTEAPELIDIAESIVVFDHHRQGSDVITNAALSYIEPYASSACEMVTEVLQYIDNDIRMRTAEADAMFAGIAIDTYNFTNQAGVRTFEAAAFLRKNGADVTRVRKLFRDSLEDYRAKAEAIHKAEIYESSFVISECRADGPESPTIVGAQAANELLDVAGIKASFVLTPYMNKIFISARSIDEVNVQYIMEKMGGGGHRSIAGAQMEGITAEEAKQQLMALISDMIRKGEIDK